MACPSLLARVLVLTATLVPGSALAQFNGRLEPSSVTFVGDAGDCFDEHKEADLVPPLPPTDVLLLVDLTGSMGEERSELVLRMNEIIDALPSRVGDVAMGLAWHRDYPVSVSASCGYTATYGGSTDDEYELHQPITTSRTDMLAAVATLPPAGGGADLPESYSGAIRAALHDPAMGWRPHARRLIVLFADDLPHDCRPGDCLGLAIASQGVDPGPDRAPGTPDDIRIEDLMIEMAADRVALLVVESSGPGADAGRLLPDADYWECWSQITGGFTVRINPNGTGTTGETLADVIVSMLEDSLDTCPVVELRAQPGFETWLTSATPVYTDVAAPAHLSFDLRICIPPGTGPGTYTFNVLLTCLGGTNAAQQVTIHVGGACSCDTGVPALAQAPLAAGCFPDAASAEAAALAATTLTSACSPPPALATSVSGDCDATVTVTATNECGSSAVGYSVRIDALAPDLLNVPTDASAPCHSVPAAPALDALDACDGTLPVAMIEDRVDGPCPDTYQLRRTWRAVDGCGLEATDVQVVSVADTVAPALSGVPGDAVVECHLVPPPASPVAADDCDPAPALAYSETRTDGPCPWQYELAREWTATDRCGNAALQRQVLQVQDTLPPALHGVPPDETVECHAVPPPAAPTSTDACDPAPAIAFVETRADGPCPHRYDLLRQWTATDGCGNDARQDQVVHVQDTQPPVIHGVPPDVTVECDAVPPPASPTATDGCDAAPAIAFAETRVDGRCPGDYELTRQWTATDACLNATIASQRVRVVDTTPPVIDPSVVARHCVWPPNHRLVIYGQADFAPSIRDACSGPVTWRFEGCVSSQPDDGRGDGSTAGDCTVGPDGGTIVVRTERTGRDQRGRTYVVAATAADACGNRSAPVAIGTIHVPHDQSEHPPCDRATGRR